MGRFKPGAKKPEGSGRKKGIPNRRTLLLQEVFDSKAFNVPEKLIELLPKLDDEKQASILIELMSYLFPRRKMVEHFGVDSAAMEIRQTRISLRKLIADPEAFSALEVVEEKLAVEDHEEAS